MDVTKAIEFLKERYNNEKFNEFVNNTLLRDKGQQYLMKDIDNINKLIEVVIKLPNDILIDNELKKSRTKTALIMS